MKTAIVGLAAAFIVAAHAGSVLAVGTVSLNNVAWRTGTGGEFRASPAGGNNILGQSAGVTGLYSDTRPGRSVSGFMTFCLEQGETFGWGTNYRFTVDDFAVSGANSNQVSTFYNNGYTPAGNVMADALNATTKWLYYSFRLGTLSGYNYDGTNAQRQASGVQLQRAIWSIEDNVVLGGGDTVASGWVSQALAAQSLAFRPWESSVRVLNIFTVSGNSVAHAQSQLTMTVQAVPLPPAAYAGLGTLGLAGVGAFIRRRRISASV